MRVLFPVLALALRGIALPADIPQGAHVLLRMENSINTRTAQEGDFVYLRTASPISAEGQIILPAGSYVQGVVSHTKRSGRVTGRAELGIQIGDGNPGDRQSFQIRAAPELGGCRR